MHGGQPLFWRVQNHQNLLLIESYCLICSKFIGAGRTEFHMGLVEFAHRIVCKLIDKDKNDDESRTVANP